MRYRFKIAIGLCMIFLLTGCHFHAITLQIKSEEPVAEGYVIDGSSTPWTDILGTLAEEEKSHGRDGADQ